MKVVAGLILTLACSVAPAAQTAASTDAPPDLELKAKPYRKKPSTWRPPPFEPSPVFGGERSSPSNPRPQSTAATTRGVEVEAATAQVRTMSGHTQPRGAAKDEVRGVEVQLKNKGPKVIALTKATLLILEGEQELASVPLTIRGPLKGGKSDRVNWSDVEMPLEFKEKFRAALQDGRASAVLRVERIEYEDGAAWQRP